MSLTKPTAREVLLEHGMTDLSQRQKDVAEQRFFNQIKLANGTRKTTDVNRLSDLNEICNRILSEVTGSRELLDIGISSGITTVEWMESLDNAGLQYHLDGFDLCLDGYIHTVTNWFHVLCDSTDIPLEFEVFGSPIGNYFGENSYHRVKRVIPVLLLRFFYRVAKSSGLSKSDKQQVRLVTHRLTDSDKFRIFEFDISRVHELDKRYSMIRAANILNLEYFDREFLSDAVRKLKGQINDGGFLCVARTHADGTNHATVYRKAFDRFEVIERLGKGSEIESIIVSLDGE